MPQLSLRHSHRNTQLGKQRAVKMPQSVPAQTRDAEPIASCIDRSFKEIPVTQWFAISRGEHQVRWTSFNQASSLPQCCVNNRAEWYTPLRAPRLHCAEVTSVECFNHPQDCVLKIHPALPQSKNFFDVH